MVVADYKAAIAERDAAKITLEALEQELTQHATTPLDAATVDSYLQESTDIKNKLLNCNNIIYVNAPASTDMNPHVTEHSDLFKRAIRAHAAFKGIKMSFPVQPPPSSTSTVNPTVRLPTLELPSFGGNLQEWVSFRDIFEAAVGSRTTLTKSQKLTYLKTCLVGEAAKHIRSLVLSDANYDIAWKALTDRYHNERELLFAILKRLTNQSNVSSSAVSVRALIDTTKECTRSLETLSIPVQHWDAILVFLIFQKLDSSSRELWEQQLKDSSIPSLDDMYTFLEQRARALSAGAVAVPTRSQAPRLQHNRQSPQNFHVDTSSPCKLECGGASHPLFACTKFRNMTVSDRNNQIKNLNLCFNCLSEGHSVATCENKHSCKTCGQRHHTMIHQTQRLQEPQQPNKQFKKKETPPSSVSSHHVQNEDIECGMIATAVIKVIDENGQYHPVRAMLDGGSQVCFISEKCKTRIGQQLKNKSTTVTGLQGANVGTSHGFCTFAITTHFNSDVNISVSALVVPKISKKQPSIIEDISDWNHIKHLKLADPSFNVPATVDILLGAQVFYSVLEAGKILGPQGAPLAISSSLGWLVGGRTSTSRYEVNSFVTDIDLDNSLKRFWEAEHLPEETAMTTEERECEEHFASTHTRNLNGRFTVSIPLKSPCSSLGNSRNHALCRLLSLEKRLGHHNNPAIQAKRNKQREEYNLFMSDYEEMGHMILLKESKQDINYIPSYYIPHHFIEKPTSTTTKFRVVFDASAKTTSGKSLNDLMMIGPVVQDSLLSIIIRFRKHPIAFTADIAKMYRQILINPEQRNLQRILWRSHPSEQVREYALNTVTYGTAAAPYLATRCLRELAVTGKEDFPLASSILETDTYVDDIQSGSSSPSTAKQAIKELNSLCDLARLPLRKWTCNNEEVLASIPADLRETQSLIPIDTDHTIKTLGIFWNPQTDQYMFRINLPDESAGYTKRIILSEMSKIFDPLGWLSPVIITAKIFMQQLWKEHHDWDTPLPTSLQEKWKCFKTELFLLEEIKIPRCVLRGAPCKTVLCCFSDASTDAYSTCIYTCCFYVDTPPTADLVAAKSRVVPVNPPTIPRLELCGAVLLASLVKTVILSLKVNFNEIRCYTDSTITLAWINSSPQRWKTYIRRRVQSIHKNLPDGNWYHVPGIINPADCASRGISPSTLLSHALWWNGNEEMMTLSPDTTPLPDDIFQSVKNEETTKKVQCLHSTNESADSFLIRYSSFHRLCRITAWCLRLIRKGSKTTQQTITGPLTTAELKAAHNCIMRKLQQELFSFELNLLRNNKELPTNNKYLPLSPFLDQDGIIRVGGRLKNAPFKTNRKHPILLPKNHHITKSLISDTHLQQFHGGPQLVLAVLTQRYWIVNAKGIIQYVTRKCTTCVRHKAETMTQFMGHLPAARVTPSPVFSKCGLDYGGPFIIKPPTRSRVELKSYMAIFICFATKAIHLEVVKSLSTADFIAALRRFISRRGIPTDIYSDCGTNFVGASKVLNDMFESFRTSNHNQRVADECANLGIQWHFNPASAPHFGGLWEAGVRSVKHHLKRVTGSSRLTYDELETLLIQIEAILNSRPIIPASTDPNDLEALTPAHFLIGRPLTSLPDADLTDTNVGRLDRWQIIQQQQQIFWSRWSREHVTRLQQRPKWMKVSRHIQIGNMVIIKDERLPPLKWKLGRVQKLHPGPDGITRVVTLRTADGEAKRLIHKLCLLPVDACEDN